MTIGKTESTMGFKRGRKPKPPGERKLKISVSLRVQTVEHLSRTGGGVVSKGIEILMAKTSVPDQEGLPLAAGK